MQKNVLWLPISYQVEYRGYRKVNSNHRSVREDVPLSVRVFDRDEVDLVADISPYVKPEPRPEERHYSHNSKVLPWTPPFEFEIYSVDGVLMRPVTLPNGISATIQSMTDFAAAARAEQRNPARFSDYPIIAERSYESPLHMKFREELADEFYDVKGDDRAQQLTAAQRLADDLVFVGDVMMRRAIEPIIELEIDKGFGTGGAYKRGTNLRVLAAGTVQADSDTLLFRADELDLAVSIAEEIGERFNRPMHIDGDISVHLPHALEFDPAEDTRKRLFDVLDGPRRHGFSLHATVETVRSWCNARETFDAYVTDPDGSHEQLSEAILSYLGTRKHEKADNKTMLLFAQLRRLETLQKRPNPADEAVLAF